MLTQQIKVGTYYVARSERFAEKLIIVIGASSDGLRFKTRSWVNHAGEWLQRPRLIRASFILREAKPEDFARYGATRLPVEQVPA